MGERGRPRHPDILTPREWEVLELLRDGLTNEQIAERLGVSFSTARYHVSEILSKLGVSTREEAAAWRPDGERRRWPVLAPLTAAKAAGVALAVAFVAGLGVLAWSVLWGGSAANDDMVLAPTLDPSVTPAATGSPAPESTAAPLPTLAPGRDGVRLARGLYRVPPNGGEPELLQPIEGMRREDFDRESRGTGGSSIKYSPDGSWVAVMDSWDGRRYVLLSVGDSGVKLVHTFEEWGVAAVAPGADAALLGRYDDTTRSHLYSMWRRQDGSITPFLESEYEVFSAEWSPDGSQIAFSGVSADGDQETSSVYVIGSDGGVQEVASSIVAFDWSRDGTWLALAEFRTGVFYRWSREEGLEELAVHESDEVETVRLMEVSPDGRRLVYLMSGLEIYVADVEAGETRYLTAGSQPRWSPDGERIVFTRSGDLMAIEVETGEETRFVDFLQPAAAAPEWTPDGSVVFVYAPNVVGTVSILELDSGEILEVAYGNSPAWSPDGQRLAYVGGGSGSGFAGTNVVVTSRLDGSGFQEVSDFSWTDVAAGCASRVDPEWSADGRWVAHGAPSSTGLVVASTVYMSHRGLRGCSFAWSPTDSRLAIEQLGMPGREIWIVEAETLEKERVTYGTDPSWSPDGRRIAVRRGESTIVIIDVQTGVEHDPIQLPGGPPYRSTYTWSPDGRFIAITRIFKEGEGSYHDEIVLVDPEAGTADPLTEGDNPSWSPDGKSIALQRPATNQIADEIHIVSVATGEVRFLADGRAPAWSPDGTRIAFTR